MKATLSKTSLGTSSNTLPYWLTHEHGSWMRLSQLGIVEVTGQDAAAFLNRQLTQAVLDLHSEESRLAAICSHQGRIMANMLLCHNTEKSGFFLSVAADLAEFTSQHLRKLIFRSPVTCQNQSDSQLQIGLINPCPTLLGQLFPETSSGASVVRSAAGTLVKWNAAITTDPWPAGEIFPDGKCERYLWIVPANVVESYQDLLNRHSLEVDPHLWDWLDIRCGLPRITQVLKEQFVPQMVNFDIIGGLSFSKGCYPGQEVIARLRHRGQVRRRSVLAHVEQATPGAEVFSSEDDQSCGVVINSASAPTQAGGVDCLIQIRLDAMGSGQLRMVSPTGPDLILLPLPYTVPEIETALSQQH